MQIEHLSPAQWGQVTDAVTWLWITVAFVILFNGSLLFGRAVLPSLAKTRSDPTGPEHAAQIFVVFGGAAIIGVIFAAVTLAGHAEVYYDVYERVWF